jgi:hypothetical protein
MRGWVCRLQLLLVLASLVILRSECRGTHDYILLSQIRDSPKPGEPSPRFYIPKEQGSRFHFRRLLRLAGIRWRYSTSPPHGIESNTYVSFLYNFGANRIEITISDNSRYCVLILFCGNVSRDPLLKNGCPSIVDSVTSGTCLPNRCISMDVSAVLL